MELAVFGYVDPRDHEVKYVGRSSDPTLLLKRRIRRARTSSPHPLEQWIADLKAEGCRPTLVVLERLPWNDRTKHRLRATERRWQRRFAHTAMTEDLPHRKPRRTRLPSKRRLF